ncbi:MAG TPA: PfkB family carbohydrate kinase, partial [Actinospica sp.]|nr:PfkB family carbohydrate kinase [Actinospica sp.]
DIGIGAAKTGMLASTAIIEAIAETMRRLGTVPLVVDPVAASQHGDPLLRPDALGALVELLIPQATLVTPNLGEVRLLTGIEVTTRAQLPDAARAMYALGPRQVLIKGGHLPGPDAVDLLFDGTRFVELSAPRAGTQHTHGSGDTLAAAITASLARGRGVEQAVRDGKRYISAAVEGAFPLGAGLGPVGHFWRVGAWPDDVPASGPRDATA